MLLVTLAWQYCYPLVWISLVLIFEPLNCWLGREHFMEYLERGDWRPIVSLSVGALICGFFWEMWNYYSWPKRIYHTPGAQFLHVFEMPLLGYGGDRAGVLADLFLLYLFFGGGCLPRRK